MKQKLLSIPALIRDRKSLLILGIAGVVLFALSRSYDLGAEFSALARDNGLTLQMIHIAGAERTAHDAILHATGIEMGVDIFAFDVADVRSRVEELPWVKSVRVERVLPESLEIKVTERQPYALWQRQGALWLIDNSGAPIIETEPELFTSLPLLVGEGAPAAVGAFVSILKATPELERRITSLIRVGQRRWDLILDTGVRLKLPEEDEHYGLSAAWQRFSELDAEYRLLAREAAILDFRFPDRLVVRLTPEGEKAFAKEGRTT